MNGSKTERHTAPPQTDGGTTVAYAEASKAGRAGAEALEAALHDPALLPSALHAPAVTRNGESRSAPWSARGVTPPMARRVYAYASAQYLGGYSKVEAGSRWTRSSGQAPHLPLIRQTCRALGLDERSGSNRRKVGATYGYLDALGVFAYEPGKGDRYAYLAYGPVALEGRSLAAPAHRVSGGIAQRRATGSSPAAGYTKRGSLREENTLPATSQREPVAANGKRETSNTEKQKPEQRLTRAGGVFLDTLVKAVGGYGRHLGQRLEQERYRDHAALLSQARKWGALVDQSGVKRDAHLRAISRLHLGEANLDAADRLPSLLAHLLGKHYEEARDYLARHRAAEERQEWQQQERERQERHAAEARHAEAAGVALHDPESETVLRGGAEPSTLAAPLAAALAHLYPEPAALDLPEGETVGADPRTTVAAAAIAAGSAVAEVRPAYETGEPLRSRLILDAVRHGAAHGYGIPEEEAVAVHAHYLGLRQAGDLDPETDLAEVQEALGRPLALAEVALYGLSLTVPAGAWEDAVARAREPQTYSGGAAYPEPVEVREVSLAGTAVAP